MRNTGQSIANTMLPLKPAIMKVQSQFGIPTVLLKIEIVFNKGKKKKTLPWLDQQGVGGERGRITIRGSQKKKRLHTWLANMYNSRLYAAPAQAVLVTTPVALIICELNGKIRYNLGTYWSRTISARALFLWSGWDLLVAGIINQMTICINNFNQLCFDFLTWKVFGAKQEQKNHDKA